MKPNHVLSALALALLAVALPAASSAGPAAFHAQGPLEIGDGEESELLLNALDAVVAENIKADLRFVASDELAGARHPQPGPEEGRAFHPRPPAAVSSSRRAAATATSSTTTRWSARGSTRKPPT